MEAATNKKQVTIVGPGPSKSGCPYDTEIWTPDKGWKYAKRIDKVFCLGTWSSLPDLLDAQSQFKFSIVSAGELLGFDVELYPLEDVLVYAPLTKAPNRTDPAKIGFFGNDISYMIAYAVVKGYEVIKLYGIDILNSTTFLSEKGSMEYWLGVAIGRGIKVWNAPGSVVGRTHNGRMYGAWGDKTDKIKEMVKGFNI